MTGALWPRTPGIDRCIVGAGIEGARSGSRAVDDCRAAAARQAAASTAYPKPNLVNANSGVQRPFHVCTLDQVAELFFQFVGIGSPFAWLRLNQSIPVNSDWNCFPAKAYSNVPFTTTSRPTAIHSFNRG